MMTRAVVYDPTATIVAGGSHQDRLNREVFLVLQEDGGRLVDLERGRFYALDAIGAQLLSLLLAQGRDAAAACVAEDYGEPVAHVGEDVDRLVRTLRRRALLVGPEDRLGYWRRWLQWPGATVNEARPMPGRLGAFPPVPGRRTTSRWLRAAWLQLRLRGWGATVRRWRRWHRTAEVADPADRQRVVREVDRVVRDAAAGHLVLPMACKERALVGHQILRAVFGLPAELVIGIERHPFAAHAWVECDGMIVTDDRDRCELFTPVARYG
jgi:hypothetical protein